MAAMTGHGASSSNMYYDSCAYSFRGESNKMLRPQLRFWYLDPLLVVAVYDESPGGVID